MAILRAEGLAKRYGERELLRDVDLELHGGEALLVRGRSGSGKSTLLQCLAGLEPPTAGRIELEGHALHELDPKDLAALRLRSVGFVFQHFNLIPDLTAEENVRLPMTLARKIGTKERARMLLEDVGLLDRAAAKPAQLSGGEMQRVAIARALANDPSLILADEPTANLDEENARRVLAILRDLNEDERAVVVASHDPLARESFAVQLEIRDGALVPVG